MSDIEPYVPDPERDDDDAHVARKKPGPATGLTDEVHKAVMSCLSVGGFVREACLYANISMDSYYYWLRRGRLYDEHLEAGGDIIEGEDIYRLFWMDARQARSTARTRMLKVVARAALDADWPTRLRAATWYLERSDPQHWGRVNRVEMTGAGGGPMQVQVTEVEERLSADVRARAERLAAEAAEAATIEEAEIVVDAVADLDTGTIPDEV